MRDGLTRSYSIEEVAESLGVHAKTVGAWCRSGELRSINVSKNKKSQRVKFRIMQADLDNFLHGRITVIPGMEPVRRYRRRPDAPVYI